MNEMEPEHFSKDIVERLNADQEFKSAVTAWEIANIIGDPSEIYKKKIDKMQYYESILFSLIDGEFNGESGNGEVISRLTTDTGYRFAHLRYRRIGKIRQGY